MRDERRNGDERRNYATTAAGAGNFARMRSRRIVRRGSLPVIMSSIEMSSVDASGVIKSKTAT